MQTAASLRGVAGGSLEVTRRIQAQDAATRGLAAQKTALSGTLGRISRDIQTATLDFKAGRISAQDHASALRFARNEATQLGSAAAMSGSQLRTYSGILNATATQSTLAAKGTGFLKDMMSSGMAQFLGATAAMGMVRSAYAASFAAADRLSNSQRMLAGISRITGVPLADLQRVSQGVARDFKLTTVQANELTAGMNKLTQAAGQPEKMRAGVEALLDIGSARGLTTVQVLSAINNALAGNDEGTDKLFMKNPSEIYRKWAVAAGTTVDKMDSLQRAQALLDALLTDGGKVRGEYAKWLEDTPGKQQGLESATERLASAFGRLFNPMRNWVATGGAAVMNWAADLIDRFQRLGGATSGFGSTMARLTSAAMGNGKEYKTDGGFRGNLGEHPGMAALGPIGSSKISDRQIELLAKGYQLGLLTRKEEQERLAAIRQIRAELKQTTELDKRIELQKQLADLTKRSKEDIKEEREEQRRIKELLEEQRRIRVEQAGGGNRTAGFGGTPNLGDSNLATGGVPSILQGAGVRPGVRSGVAAASASQAKREGALKQWADRQKQAAAEVATQFASLGTNLGLTIMDGFAAAMGAGMRGKNPFKAFGKTVLAGLGSIFTQMGKSLLTFGATMMGLLPALSNPFTSGPAALVAGALLLALGSTLGGIATGSSGGGGGGSYAQRDQVTRITLTNPGAGGQSAPEARQPLHVTVIGPDDLTAQRQLSKLMDNAKRRGY